jgi:hypothetical protein
VALDCPPVRAIPSRVRHGRNLHLGCPRPPGRGDLSRAR